MELPVPHRDPEQEFERLRGAFAGQLEQWPDFARSRRSDAVHPLVDLEETDDGYRLEVELPGVDLEDVDLQVEPGRLRLHAERRDRRPTGSSRHRTRSDGPFALDLALPGLTCPAEVTARLDRGVLTVVVPKDPSARRRRIPVRRRS